MIERLTPGRYLKKRREAAKFAIGMLPIGADAARAIEADERFPYDSELQALRCAVPFDLDVLLAIAAGEQPRICRLCACSEFDPCEDALGQGCAWLEADLCTECALSPADPA